MPNHRVEPSERRQRTASAGGDQRRGAYGLEVEGLSAPELLTPLPANLAWPKVHVTRRPHVPAPTPSDLIDRSRGDVALLDGDRAVVDRDARSATLLTASAEDDGRMAHPFLTVVAALFGWWLGRDLFHGGAVSINGSAWALIGHEETGKSSLLAQLAASGHTVLADDLVVIEEGDVLAGARCLDLRTPALELIDLSQPTQPVRAGDRHRLGLGPAPPAMPLCGWIFLSWGSRLRARRLGPADRLRGLLAERSAGGRLLELVRLPGWQLERSRRGGSIAAAAELVVELAAGRAR